MDGQGAHPHRPVSRRRARSRQEPAMRYADAPAGAVTTAALFDTANFPIDQPDSASYERLVGSARTGLAEHNCVVIDGMVRSSTLAAMCCEAVAQAPAATCTEAWLNPYFSTPPRDCPADHPLRRLALRRHGMIRADRFDTGGTIRAVFENSDLTRFVAACLGYAPGVRPCGGGRHHGGGRRAWRCCSRAGRSAGRATSRARGRRCWCSATSSARASGRRSRCGWWRTA